MITCVVQVWKQNTLMGSILRCMRTFPHPQPFRRREGTNPPLPLGSVPFRVPRDEGEILLTGHFDVVEPEPDDSQFTPRIEGDYLHGRGAADMKTVVATYMVWMKNARAVGAPYPLRQYDVDRQ